MFDRRLDMAKLEDYAIPEAAVHQTVGTGYSLLSEELEVSLLYYVTESRLIVAITLVSTRSEAVTFFT